MCQFDVVNVSVLWSPPWVLSVSTVTPEPAPLIVTVTVPDGGEASTTE